MIIYNELSNENLVESVIAHPILISFTVLSFTFFLKFSLKKYIKKRAKLNKKDSRNTINNIEHFISFAFISTLLLIWAAELQNFALSITAFAAAIVLATREFIQCFVGFLYVITARPFKIGDWIRLGESYGEVVATNWIKTTLNEIDIETYQLSRKTLFIPNSNLISSPIMNMNYIRRFVTHEFIITRKDNINPFPIYQELLSQSKSYCESFHDLAIRYNSILERRLDSPIAGPEPEIYFMTSDSGDFKARFIIFCPTEHAIEIEKKITSDFMELWYSEVQKKH